MMMMSGHPSQRTHQLAQACFVETPLAGWPELPPPSAAGLSWWIAPASSVCLRSPGWWRWWWFREIFLRAQFKKALMLTLVMALIRSPLYDEQWVKGKYKFTHASDTFLWKEVLTVHLTLKCQLQTLTTNSAVSHCTTALLWHLSLRVIDQVSPAEGVEAENVSGWKEPKTSFQMSWPGIKREFQLTKSKDP